MIVTQIIKNKLTQFYKRDNPPAATDQQYSYCNNWFAANKGREQAWATYKAED